MTGERGRDGRREITRDLGQHTARPACQSSLSYSRTYSHILSFLSYTNARFLFPCRTAVFLPPSYVTPPAVIGVPNRTPRSAIMTHRAIVILERGAARRNAIEPRQARGFWQADFCASNTSRITMALSYNLNWWTWSERDTRRWQARPTYARTFLDEQNEKLKRTLFDEQDSQFVLSICVRFLCPFDRIN